MTVRGTGTASSPPRVLTGTPDPLADPQGALACDIAGFYDDPLGYVRYNFPWGTGVLEDFPGPREWQADFLRELGQEIRIRDFDGHTPCDPVDTSTASGHGIGKSALTAWLVKFIFDTRPYSKGIVTANTSDQLKTKTWSEVGKWHRLSLTESWAKYNTSKGNMNLASHEHPETWRVDAVSWRKESAEAFAGLHAANSTAYYIFDEASLIPEEIMEVSDGGLTDGEPMRFMFGNPTRNSGRFFKSHHRLKHRYLTRQIDSRSVEGATNLALIKRWEEDYGADSDFFRVRVLGRFPRAASTQFIGFDVFRKAATRELHEDRQMPLVLGVDVARFGDDKSVIYPRMGRDARSHGYWKYRGMDTMQLAAQVVEKINHFAGLGKPVAAVFVDGAGVGGGVIDRLKQLQVNVIEVNPGAGADNKQKYANKRAEMWGNGKDWLAGGCVMNEDELETDLTGLEYGFNRSNAIQLERKEDMKGRGLASPDLGDALMLTFAYPIAPVMETKVVSGSNEVGSHDYDPMENV